MLEVDIDLRVFDGLLCAFHCCRLSTGPLLLLLLSQDFAQHRSRRRFSFHHCYWRGAVGPVQILLLLFVQLFLFFVRLRLRLRCRLLLSLLLLLLLALALARRRRRFPRRFCVVVHVHVPKPPFPCPPNVSVLLDLGPVVPSAVFIRWASDDRLLYLLPCMSAGVVAQKLHDLVTTPHPGAPSHVSGDTSHSVEAAAALVARIRPVLVLQQRPGGAVLPPTPAFRAQSAATTRTTCLAARLARGTLAPLACPVPSVAGLAVPAEPGFSFERPAAPVARIRPVLVLQQRPAGGILAKATSAACAQSATAIWTGTLAAGLASGAVTPFARPACSRGAPLPLPPLLLLLLLFVSAFSRGWQMARSTRVPAYTSSAPANSAALRRRFRQHFRIHGVLFCFVRAGGHRGHGLATALSDKQSPALAQSRGAAGPVESGGFACPVARAFVLRQAAQLLILCR